MRKDIPEENLTATGAGHPHVLKDESVGKKIGLPEPRALAGTQIKNESL